MNNVYGYMLLQAPIYLASGCLLACGCVLCSLVVHSGKWFVIIITGCIIHRLLRPCFSRKSVLSFDDTTIITTDNNSNAIINDSRFIKVVTQHDAFKKQPDSHHCVIHHHLTCILIREWIITALYSSSALLRCNEE